MNPKSMTPVRRAHGPAAATREGRSKPKSAEHPLATLAGIFKDDPLWDEYVEALRRARAEEDMQEVVSG